MTSFELITTVISFTALALSGYALFTQRRLQRENNELQKATSDLARKQLEMLVRDDHAKTSARIKLDLFRDGKTYRFRLTNISDVDARNVSFNLLLNDGEDNPLIESEVQEKLPAPKLSPGSDMTLIAALHMGTPTAYRARITWKDPDGSEVSNDTYVSL